LTKIATKRGIELRNWPKRQCQIREEVEHSRPQRADFIFVRIMRRAGQGTRTHRHMLGACHQRYHVAGVPLTSGRTTDEKMPAI
jgi:hypothetical protein